MGKGRRRMGVVAPLPPGHLAGTEAGVFDEPEVSESETREMRQQRDVLLRRPAARVWRCDAFLLLLLDHLQVYGLLLVLAAQHAAWPTGWTSATTLTTAFNLDVWGLRRQWDAYSSNSEVVPSSWIDLNYGYYCVMWLVALTLAVLTMLLARQLLFRKLFSHFHALTRWEMTAAWLLHTLTIPVGLVVARLFHCVDASGPYLQKMSSAASARLMEVAMQQICWGSRHWELLGPGICVALLLVAIPLGVRHVVARQLLGTSATRHEAYVTMKEVEYAYGLDLIWALGHFHLFSSFHWAGVHLRSHVLLLKLALLALLAGLRHYPATQALSIFCVLLVWSLILAVVRPFRIHAFNLMAPILSFTNTCNALLLYLRTSDSAAALIHDPHFTRLLIVINVLPLAFFILWYMRLELQYRGWIRSVPNDIAPRENPARGTHYTSLVIQIQRLLKQTRAGPLLLAPVPELAHYVQQLDAASKRAQRDCNPATSMLYALLDELIIAHNHAVPHSLFGRMPQPTASATINELVALAPKLARRLAQRDFDFILISPRKRRLLLKLYCISTFMKRSH